MRTLGKKRNRLHSLRYKVNDQLFFLFSETGIILFTHILIVACVAGFLSMRFRASNQHFQLALMLGSSARCRCNQ